jgi:hypothetical protein
MVDNSSDNMITLISYLSGISHRCAKERFETTEHGKLKAAAELLNEQDQLGCFKVKIVDLE